MYKLKESLRIFDLRKFDGNIYIGINLPTAITIEKPTHAFVKMLHLLNGKNSINTISKQIEIPIVEIRNAIKQLISLHVVDNIDAEKQILTDKEKDYYSRQLNYFSIYPDTNTFTPERLQQKLRSLKIVIIGMGGGGTNVARQLVAMGIGHLTLIDKDKIELSNISRQILYDTQDIGKYKVEVAKRRLLRINPEVKIDIQRKYVHSVLDVQRSISGSDFVVLSADEPTVKILNWVNQACVRLNIPFITFGISEFVGSVGPLIVPHRGPCINCIDKFENHKNKLREERIRQMESYSFSLEEPVFPPIITMISSIATFIIWKYLITGKSQLLGSVVTIDPYSGKIKKDNWNKVENCSICGQKDEK